MNYKITNDIKKATHWIAYEDENLRNKKDSYIGSAITPNKIYKIDSLHCELFNDYEYYNKSDDGDYGMYFLVHNGDYIILPWIYKFSIFTSLLNFYRKTIDFKNTRLK